MSDLHLSEKAPTARLEQGEDWEVAMEKVLYELSCKCEQLRVPLIIAGDLFDVPKPSPAVIRLAWSLLPKDVFVVAGNHDLPNHSMIELDDSGLGLMIHAERVKLLHPWVPVNFTGTHKKRQVHVYGFSWGEKLGIGAISDPLHVNVAVIHRYCWVEGHTHPGAKPEDHMDVQIEELLQHEFCAAVWGDNHRNHWKPYEGAGTRWYNSGVAIPRNSDFKDYKPTYALLMDDGSFKVQEFKAKAEWQPWVDAEKTEKATTTLLEFAREVAGLVGSKVSENFLDELETAMSGVKDENVRKKVWEILQMAQRTKR